MPRPTRLDSDAIADRATDTVRHFHKGNLENVFRDFEELGTDERYKAALRVALKTQHRPTPYVNGNANGHATGKALARGSRIRWRAPSKKERKETDKAWQAEAGPLALRVERAVDSKEGVLFRAYVENEFVGHDKLMSNAQAIASDYAIRKLQG